MCCRSTEWLTVMTTISPYVRRVPRPTIRATYCGSTARRSQAIDHELLPHGYELEETVGLVGTPDRVRPHPLRIAKSAWLRSIPPKALTRERLNGDRDPALQPVLLLPETVHRPRFRLRRRFEWPYLDHPVGDCARSSRDDLHGLGTAGGLD